MHSCYVMNTFPPRPCSCSLNSSIAKQLAERRQSPDSYPWPLKILESCALVYNRTEESSPDTMSYSLGTMPRTLTPRPSVPLPSWERCTSCNHWEPAAPMGGFCSKEGGCLQSSLASIPSCLCALTATEAFQLSNFRVPTAEGDLKQAWGWPSLISRLSPVRVGRTRFVRLKNQSHSSVWLLASGLKDWTEVNYVALFHQSSGCTVFEEGPRWRRELY